MINSFLIWLLDYVQYILILPISIAIFRFRFLTKELKVIWYFLLMSVFFEVLSRTLLYLKFQNTLSLLHLYTVLEFINFGLFYHIVLGNFFSKKLIPNTIICFTLFAIINAFFIQKLDNFNTYASGIESILIIGLSLMCFYKMLIELDTRNPTKQPVFWINSGLLFYFAGSLFIFILSNFIKSDNHLLSLAWGMHAFLMVILHIFISIGLWLSPRR
ncbi:hypothetical protein EMA8858_01779 [Emticicia aquatica]|uniref:Uncharacterized protein n=1 Tax=Emticicia aquatica TaxID=1681835 RepID=A0ABN8ERY3_9BACT|nr:hypothetical protein [Emticicia aquatica]CAH0995654.1 hypothetical protein EMA8858_01779 [Emticicia aquatica]